MRVIFYIIVAYIVYTLVKKITSSTQAPIKRGKGKAGYGEAGMGKAEETVLDPVCESYIPKDRAINTTHGGKEYFFCSQECRDKFITDRGDKGGVG